MLSAKFKTAIPVSLRPQIHAFDRAATGSDISNISKGIKSNGMLCASHVTFTRKNRNVDRISARKLEGKRPFGKHRCGLHGKVRIYLGFDGTEYIHVTLRRGIQQSLISTLRDIQFTKMPGFSGLIF
jgi:hypothetical protein